MNKTQFAEKRYRGKVEKDKKEIRLNTKKNIKNKTKKIEKVKKILKKKQASITKNKEDNKITREKRMS